MHCQPAMPCTCPPTPLQQLLNAGAGANTPGAGGELPLVEAVLAMPANPEIVQVCFLCAFLGSSPCCPAQPSHLLPCTTLTHLLPCTTLTFAALPPAPPTPGAPGGGRRPIPP